MLIDNNVKQSNKKKNLLRSRNKNLTLGGYIYWPMRVKLRRLFYRLIFRLRSSLYSQSIYQHLYNPRDFVKIILFPHQVERCKQDLSSHPDMTLAFHSIFILFACICVPHYVCGALSSCLELKSPSSDGSKVRLKIFRDSKVLPEFYSGQGECGKILHVDSVRVNGICNGLDFHEHNVSLQERCAARHGSGSLQFKKCWWNRYTVKSGGTVNTRNAVRGRNLRVELFDHGRCQTLVASGWVVVHNWSHLLQFMNGRFHDLHWSSEDCKVNCTDSWGLPGIVWDPKLPIVKQIIFTIYVLNYQLVVFCYRCARNKWIVYQKHTRLLYNMMYYEIPFATWEKCIRLDPVWLQYILNIMITVLVNSFPSPASCAC